jgi:hypothetical protein
MVFKITQLIIFMGWKMIMWICVLDENQLLCAYFDSCDANVVIFNPLQVFDNNSYYMISLREIMWNYSLHPIYYIFLKENYSVVLDYK